MTEPRTATEELADALNAFLAPIEALLVRTVLDPLAKLLPDPERPAMPKKQKTTKAALRAVIKDQEKTVTKYRGRVEELVQKVDELTEVVGGTEVNAQRVRDALAHRDRELAHREADLATAQRELFDTQAELERAREVANLNADSLGLWKARTQELEATLRTIKRERRPKTEAGVWAAFQRIQARAATALTNGGEA